MIELFKTHCKLPDGSVGEVCKKLKDGWLVCNSSEWWVCEEEWIEKNLDRMKTRYEILIDD